MNKTLQAVAEFHKTFSHPIANEIVFNVGIQVRKLRHDLIHEEYLELLKAESDNDTVEIADALCDLLYVLNGTILAHGLHNIWDALYSAYLPIMGHKNADTDFKLSDYLHSEDDSFVRTLLNVQFFIASKVYDIHKFSRFDEMFDEVHSSNMSKVCDNLEDAQATAASYVEQGINADFKIQNGKYIVLNMETGKILKNIKWRTPNLEQFL